MKRLKKLLYTKKNKKKFKRSNFSYDIYSTNGINNIFKYSDLRILWNSSNVSKCSRKNMFRKNGNFLKKKYWKGMDCSSL